jgi:hypothetical protein
MNLLENILGEICRKFFLYQKKYILEIGIVPLQFAYYPV